MTYPQPTVSRGAQEFNWLLGRFASDTPGVIDAIAVSADGLLVAMSVSLTRADADRLAAIASAVASLAAGTGRMYDLGSPRRVVVDLERGYLLVSAITAGLSLGLLARPDANLGNLAYEMATFANRAGSVLTPQLINELKTSLPA